MNKSFIKRLITKPDKYILVWVYIFSRLDEENKAVIFLVELSAKYNVPKSTLKRIVSYGGSIYGSNMDFKWVSNHLYISILNNTNELAVVKKRTKNEPKMTSKRTPAKINTLYAKMIKDYDAFCEDKTGVGCKIDGAQGKSMKRIIKFLETQCQKKDTKLIGGELEEKVLLAWRYILSNWEKLDDFNRGRIKLTEIDSSMLNILSKLKEKPINKKQKQRHEQISKAIDSAKSTDYSGLGSGT